MLTIGSLFSGIGGLEIAVEHVTGGETIWQAESDEYCRAVLAKHWPGVHCYEDVKEIGDEARRPDIICGGFPCQDISVAGKGAGIAGERSGLWSEFARIVRILRPRIVFVENVAALAIRGLDEVLADLAACGFDAEWDVLGACCVGAPHKRERLFLLAADASRDALRFEPERMQRDRRGVRAAERGNAEPGDDGAAGSMAHTDGGRCEVGGLAKPRRVEGTRGGEPVGRGQVRELEHVARRLPGWLAESGIRRVSHGVPCRSHRLRALGNAVVPAQASAAWELLSARLETI